MMSEALSCLPSIEITTAAVRRVLQELKHCCFLDIWGNFPVTPSISFLAKRLAAFRNGHNISNFPQKSTFERFFVSYAIFYVISSHLQLMNHRFKHSTAFHNHHRFRWIFRGIRMKNPVSSIIEKKPELHNRQHQKSDYSDFRSAPNKQSVDRFYFMQFSASVQNFHNRAIQRFNGLTIWSVRLWSLSQPYRPYNQISIARPPFCIAG